MKKYFAILFLVPFFLQAQNITVSAKTDSTKYKIGDFIDFKIEITSPEKSITEIPEFADSLSPLVLVKKGNVEKSIENGRKKETYHFYIAGYDSIDTYLKPIPVIIYNQKHERIAELKTNPLRIIVNAVQVDLSKEIKDVKPPIALPLDLLTIFIWVFVIAILSLIGYFVWKKYLKKEKVEAEKIIILPPFQIAINKLNELVAKRLWQNGKIKEFHSEITEIIREYFEAEFKFNSLEITSQETIRELENRNLNSEQIKIITEFLSNADMVKFAKFQPLPYINETMTKQAFEIIENLKPKEIEIGEVK